MVVESVDGALRRTSSVPASSAPLSPLVLVVDGSDVVRDTTQRMLRRLGLEAHTVGSTPLAVNVAMNRAGRIGLVLYDALDPECPHPRLRSCLPGVPMVPMSAMHEDANAAADAGIATDDGFLPKPFTLQLLSTVVAGTLRTTSLRGAMASRRVPSSESPSVHRAAG